MNETALKLAGTIFAASRGFDPTAPEDGVCTPYAPNITGKTFKAVSVICFLDKCSYVLLNHDACEGKFKCDNF